MASVVKEKEAKEQKNEAKISFDRNNDHCSVEATTEILKEEEEEIIADVDYRKDHILESKCYEIIQEVVAHETKENQEKSSEEINQSQEKDEKAQKTHRLEG